MKKLLGSVRDGKTDFQEERHISFLGAALSASSSNNLAVSSAIREVIAKVLINAVTVQVDLGLRDEGRAVYSRLKIRALKRTQRA